jgi:hypothetical protein
VAIRGLLDELQTPINYIIPVKTNEIKPKFAEAGPFDAFVMLFT